MGRSALRGRISQPPDSGVRPTWSAQPRPLDQFPEARALEPFFYHLDFSQILVHRHLPWHRWARRWLPQRAASRFSGLLERRLFNDPVAITWRRHIYFRTGFFDVHSSRGLALVGHELAHVRQFQEIGLMKFVTRYMFSFTRNLLAGQGWYRAYRNIPFEIEAFDLESRLLQQFENADSTSKRQIPGNA